MVWSVINFQGTGRLQIVKGTMKQDQYQDILQKRFVSQLQEWFPNGEKCIFILDGAPCHKAKTITKFLAHNNIEVLEWPGNSPDMNPIENICQFLKKEIAKNEIKNKVHLIEKLVHEWNHSEELQNKVRNCISSMPRRIKALIAAKGHPTKY